MKKLMSLMLGLTMLTTTVAVTFAQEAPKKDASKGKKKKNGKKKTQTPKKDGGSH
jgi:hypothetical protein